MYNLTMGTASGTERRLYYRHPLRTHMQFRLGAGQPAHSSETHDISFAGLSFKSHLPIERGANLLLAVGLKKKVHDLRAKVAYASQEADGYYRIGVAFLDSRGDFRHEITQMALSIYEYQKELIQKTGHEISEAEAARQWIEYSP